MGTCEKCAEDRTGSDYRFRYGTSCTESRTEGRTVKEVTHYRVSEPRGVFLCDECVDAKVSAEKRAVIRVLVVTLALLGSAVPIALVLNAAKGGAVDTSMYMLMTLVAVLVVLLGGLLVWLRRRMDAGTYRTRSAEMLAIEVLKPSLKEQGYTHFWNSEAYEILQR